MKFSYLSVLALALLVFSSCGKSDETMTDAELIQAIQQASDKQSITEQELPSTAQSELETKYTESVTDESLLAPELGFEVTTRRVEGVRIGERTRIYFNIDGRRLRSGRPDGDGEYGRPENENERPGDNGTDREDCFELVYPVTFTMPDGTEITGNNEEEVGLAMRDWYVNNSGTEESPSLNYPVDVMYEDGSTATVNSDEELRGAFEDCE